jgi:prolyl-tRNA synthetase
MLDIATARAGEGCPRCGAPLSTSRGIEVGHVFKLGSFFSERMGATFIDRDGVVHPILMGCYGIGIGRLLAAAIEQYHDENGIVWPVPIAPYQVHLCPLSIDNKEVAAGAEGLYAELRREGLEVLLDDRKESPGVKLNDADLLGMPIRAVLSPRTLKEGSVEVKTRQEKQAALVPLGEASAKITAILFSK